MYVGWVVVDDPGRTRAFGHEIHERLTGDENSVFGVHDGNVEGLALITASI